MLLIIVLREKCIWLFHKPEIQLRIIKLNKDILIMSCEMTVKPTKLTHVMDVTKGSAFIKYFVASNILLANKTLCIQINLNLLIKNWEPMFCLNIINQSMICWFWIALNKPSMSLNNKAGNVIMKSWAKSCIHRNQGKLTWCSFRLNLAVHFLTMHYFNVWQK